MQQHPSFQPTNQQPSFQPTNQLPALPPADQHVAAEDPASFPAAPAAFAGGSGAAVSGGAPHLKQLPTLFQWDFKTTTTTEPSGGKSGNQAATSTAAPRPESIVSTKTPRIVTQPTATVRPSLPTAAVVQAEEDEAATTAASRIPKIYGNNPKIDPFTEPPALVSEVTKFIEFMSLWFVVILLLIRFVVHHRPPPMDPHPQSGPVSKSPLNFPKRSAFFAIQKGQIL